MFSNREHQSSFVLPHLKPTTTISHTFSTVSRFTIMDATEEKVFKVTGFTLLELQETADKALPPTKATDLLNAGLSDTVVSCHLATNPAFGAPTGKPAAKKKKKNPQTKLDKFFKPKTTGKATKVPATNFQGFKKSLCRFEPTIKDYVYIPKGYGHLHKKNYYYGGEEATFCQYCNLAPCIVREHADDIKRHRQSAMLEDPATMRMKLFKYVRDLMEGYFGKRYMKRIKPPLCVSQRIDWMYPEVDSSDLDASEDDD